MIDEVGELVVTEPMPSMPVCFWGDPDGSRYRASYFEHVPGRLAPRRLDRNHLARHRVIYGRSDSTINRSGIRMGTSEIYRAVLGVDAIVDALVVDIPRPGTEGWMPLFVVLREGAELDDELPSARSPAASASTARRATSPTRSSRSPRCPAPSAARFSRCRSSGS